MVVKPVRSALTSKIETIREHISGSLRVREEFHGRPDGPATPVGADSRALDEPRLQLLEPEVVPAIGKAMCHKIYLGQVAGSGKVLVRPGLYG